ncbi:MAG: IS110 family transposase [Gammaproteobacteria bacterium]|nr:IS110 family transposase [Gammaproteobacteria bacterium]
MVDTRPEAKIRKAKANEYKTLKKYIQSVKMEDLPKLNPNTAGIDIASEVHYVAVPSGRDPKGCIREFGPSTPELRDLADWLKECGVQSVAMESTGNYWIPLFELLEQRGFDVIVVHAQYIKQIPGKKTDVLDCQWIQTLHAHGLLKKCFRPSQEVGSLRTYMRNREIWIQQASSHIQHMQKALDLMNVLVHRVVSDITGATGMKIIKAILAGERNPKVLAGYRDYRCRKSVEEISKGLDGHFQEQYIFCLRQALAGYEMCQEMLRECDLVLERALIQYESALYPEPESKSKQEALEQSDQPLARKPKGNEPHFNVEGYLRKISGVDLLAVGGIGAVIGLTIISEHGVDLSAWACYKKYTSWLGLCCGNNMSGKKSKSGKTRAVKSRVANAYRMAASTVRNSRCPLGKFYRRMKAKLGPAEAVTATAHKIARIVYTMLTTRTEYSEEMVEIANDDQTKKRRKRLEKLANDEGMFLLDAEQYPQIFEMLLNSNDLAAVS